MAAQIFNSARGLGFDSSFPNPRKCDEFSHRYIAPSLFSMNSGPITVRPGPFQGEECYSTVMTATDNDERVLVQFQYSRPGRQKLFFGHLTEGNSGPQVEFWGALDGSLVYNASYVVSPKRRFVQPRNWVPTDDYGLMLEKMLTTARDLGRFFTTNLLIKQAVPRWKDTWDLTEVLSNAQQWIFSRHWENVDTFCSLGYVIDLVRSNIKSLGDLPYAQFHRNISPDSFFREHGGELTFIGGWDQVYYAPVGTNFSSFRYLLGPAFKAYRQDPGTRREIDRVFYETVQGRLHRLGHTNVDFKLLQAARAAGLLKYTVDQATKPGTDWMEAQLTLQVLAFMESADNVLN